MAQMRKTPKYQSPSGPGKFIGTREADKAKELKRIKEGKPTYAGKPKAKPSTVQQVAKRFGITAREVRDIATAVSTAARTVTDSNVSGRAGGGGGVASVTKKGKQVGPRELAGEVRGRAVRNIAKQVGEVYTAATKGKSGTQSAEIKSVKSKSGKTVAERYALETKRKQGSKK
jgi:hypothetical protein